MSKNQFIRKSMSGWNSNDPHDWKEKQKIADILRDGFKYFCVFDRTIFVNKKNFAYSDKHPTSFSSKEDILQDYYIFKPDIFIKSHNIIIEIDGLFHFNTTKGVKQTNKRNEIYEYMGVKFIWFTTKQVKKSTDAELYQLIKEKI